MVQAYCRGLLSPGYECGVQTLAREELIMWALAFEHTGRTIQNSIQAELSLYGPHIDINKSKEYIKSTNRRLKYAAAKMDFSPRTMEEMFRSAAGSIQSLVAMYKAAEASGLLERFLQEVKQSNTDSY